MKRFSRLHLSKHALHTSGITGAILLWGLVLLAPGAIFRVDSDPEGTLIGIHVGIMALAVIVGSVLTAQVIRRRATRLEWTALGFWTLIPVGIATGWVWPEGTSLIWIFGGAALLATITPFRSSESASPLRIRELAGVGALFSLFYLGTGLAHTRIIGEHAGDEGHYLVQARSLAEDGDLDIRNQLPGATNQDRGNFHISKNARGDAWYSWHTPGLSFLLAPVMQAPLWVRHLLLGSIGGLGLAGLYGSCRTVGLTVRLALIATGFTGFSLFWGVYASRTLPEIAGAALINLGLFSTLQLRKAPFRSTVLTALCVGLLPWLQSRFLPPALTLMGIYGLESLIRSIPRPVSLVKRLGHPTLFTLMCLAYLAGYVGFQYRLFEGGNSYPFSDLLFSDPRGLWHTLGSRRGIITSFPLFLAGLAVLPGLRRMGGESRRWTVYVLLLFLSVWLTSCATRWFTGGSTLPGRFFLVISGPVIWGLARSWERTPDPLRLRFHAFLGWISVVLFFMQLAYLPQLGEAFNSSLQVTAVHPGMTRAPMFHYDPYSTFIPGGAALVFAALVFIELSRFRRLSVLVPAIVLILAVYLHGAQSISSPLPDRVRQTARLHELYSVGPQVWMRIGSAESKKDFLSVSNRFAKGVPGGLKNMTHRDLSVVDDGQWISEPNIRPNDWEGRPYRWGTLMPPYRPPEGPILVRLQGHVEGSSPVELVLREGSVNHDTILLPPGEAFDVTFDALMSDKGDLYLLARFREAGGELVSTSLEVSSYTPGMLRVGKWIK